MVFWTARAGQQLSDHHLDFFLMCVVEIGAGRAAEKMDDIPLLPVIPPAQPFHFQAEGGEGVFGLFDLNLKTAGSEGKRKGVVEQNFHMGRDVFIPEKGAQRPG